jgi:hypothetical protein
MIDPTSQLRSATRRAKSDVANKLISMFLHELSRTASKNWALKVESEGYGAMVRAAFGNRCPYCDIDLLSTTTIVEHLDGMNRYRVGLHVPGNVVVACRKCNNEKRRDDSSLKLTLAASGWESFMSHDGRCGASCRTCIYWTSLYPDSEVRTALLLSRTIRIQEFRSQFSEFQSLRDAISTALPTLVTKLYSDCQKFAETEISILLGLFMAKLDQSSANRTPTDDHTALFSS